MHGFHKNHSQTINLISQTEKFGKIRFKEINQISHRNISFEIYTKVFNKFLFGTSQANIHKYPMQLPQPQSSVHNNSEKLQSKISTISVIHLLHPKNSTNFSQKSQSNASIKTLNKKLLEKFSSKILS